MEKPITTKNFYDIMIRLAFLTLIVAWCLMILLPFFSIILWSIILAMALKPLHDSMSKKLGGRLKLTSGIIILFFVLMILIPGWLFFDSIIEGVKNLKANFDAGTLTIPPPTEDVKTWPVIGGKLYDTWFAASQNLMGFVMQYKEQLMGVGSKLLKSLLSV
jgi:predicted PurR-regulated permease PerM